MAENKITVLRHLQLMAMRCSAMVTSKISELTEAISQDLQDLDDAKQDTLTFDTTPTLGSSNPVTSDGVAKCMTQVVGDIDTVLDSIVSGAEVSEINELLDEINGEVA